MKKPCRAMSIRQSKKYFKLLSMPSGKSLIKLSYVRVLAPEIFRLTTEKERQALISMVSKIRSNIFNKKIVLIDFSKTRIMVSDGALVFYAEILRIFDNFSWAYGKIKCTTPVDNKIREVLHQIGLLKMLNPFCSATSKRDDVVNWRAAHGKVTDGKSYDKILGHYEGKITEALEDGLYNGITEAMTNSSQHAYIAPRKDNISISASYKSWWMFSQEKDEMLSVVFCDLGAGIPGTLPITRPSVYDKLKLAFGKELKDSRIINEAVQVGRTRTLKPHRGYGLPQMVDLVKGFDSGQVVIHSNKGCYIHKNGEDKHYDFSSSILGTLIFWQVPVGS